MLLAHIQLGFDQEFSVASLQSFFPAGWPSGIILLVQDLACPYVACFLTYKRDLCLNMFSDHSGKDCFSHCSSPFSLYCPRPLLRGEERELNSAETVVAF